MDNCDNPLQWDKIEAEYRAGVKPLRAIGDEFGCTEGAIRKRAKREQWPRDLSARIKAEAESLVRKEAVRKEERKCVPERDVVAANAKIQSDIILAHRSDVPVKRELVAKLFREIEAITDNQDLTEQLTLALGSGDMEQLAKAANKIASLPTRIKGVTDLTNAYKTLITLERQVFGIDNGDEAKTEITVNNHIPSAVEEAIQRGLQCGAKER